MSSAYRRNDEVNVFARVGPQGLPAACSGWVTLHEVIGGSLVSLDIDEIAYNPGEAVEAGRVVMLVKLIGVWVVERVEE